MCARTQIRQRKLQNSSLRRSIKANQSRFAKSKMGEERVDNADRGHRKMTTPACQSPPSPALGSSFAYRARGAKNEKFRGEEKNAPNAATDTVVDKLFIHIYATITQCYSNVYVHDCII